MKYKGYKIASLVCIFTWITMSNAIFAALEWEGIGPYGGDQSVVEILPGYNNILFAAASFAIHKSTDAGNNWIPLHTVEMSLASFLSLVLDPSDTRHIFVASNIDGVWYSSNQGDTWENRSDGLPTATIGGTDYYYPVVSLAFDSNNHLFAGLSENALGDTPPALIYQLDDETNSWEMADTGINITLTDLNQKITSLLSSDSNNKLWTMVHGAGVYIYTAGQWNSKNGDLPKTALRCTFLEHDENNPDHLLLGTESDWIYEKKDSGNNWTLLTPPDELTGLNPLPLVYNIVIDPNNPDVIWVDVADALGSIETPLFQAQLNQTSGGGTYVSLDGGTTWMDKRRDSAFRITIDPTETVSIPPFPPVTRSKIWYKTSGGGYASMQKSEDGAVNFTPITNGLKNILVNTLWLHPSPPTEHTRMLFSADESGLYLLENDNNDTTWEYQQPVENYLYTWSFAANPSNPNVIYYSTGNPAWSFTDQRGIYSISLDCFGEEGCEPTQLISDVGVWRVITTSALPEKIYAACQENGIMVSNNSGQTWSTLNNGLTLPQSVTDIELDSAGVPLYASTRTSNGNVTATPSQSWQPSLTEKGRVYYFDSQTQNWGEMPNMEFATLDLELDSSDTETIFGTTVNGIYKTSNNGATWVNKLPNIICYDLLIDSESSDTMYAATIDGVYRSTNGGIDWKEFSNGLTLKNVYSLALDTEADILYAGTGGNSVFKLMLNEEEEEDTPPSDSDEDGGGGGGGGGGCFIATACYGTNVEAIDVLCKLRDDYLLKNTLGRAFVELYYKCSPPIARFTENHVVFRKIVKSWLSPIIFVSQKLTQEENEFSR